MAKLRLGLILENFSHEDIKRVVEALDDADASRKKQKLEAVLIDNEDTLLKMGIMPKYLAYCILHSVEQFKKN